jgi:hypothetical protein
MSDNFEITTKQESDNTKASKNYLQGNVRFFTVHTENSIINNNYPEIVWNFRLSRLDENGDELAPIQVEMRGLKSKGTIAEGDEVKIHKEDVDDTTGGGVLIVNRLYNATTNSWVKLKTQEISRKAFWIFLVIICVFIATGVTISFIQEIIFENQTRKLEQEYKSWQEKSKQDNVVWEDMSRQKFDSIRRLMQNQSPEARNNMDSFLKEKESKTYSMKEQYDEMVKEISKKLDSLKRNGVMH